MEDNPKLHLSHLCIEANLRPIVQDGTLRRRLRTSRFACALHTHRKPRCHLFALAQVTTHLGRHLLAVQLFGAQSVCSQVLKGTGGELFAKYLSEDLSRGLR